MTMFDFYKIHSHFENVDGEGYVIKEVGINNSVLSKAGGKR